LTGAEGERTFFLKRLGRPGLKQIFECLIALERPISKCMREWKYARILAEYGLDAAPLAAAGEVRLGPFPLESFLVAGEIDGGVNLDEFLEGRGPDRPAPSEKRRLIHRLADTVARMHGAHIFHQDLYAKHIFVGRRGGDFAINIIDLQRMRVSGRGGLAVKDLAALNVTLSLNAASTADRIRFLAEYARLRLGGADRSTLKRLAAAVVKRSLWISRRSKFRNIAWRREDG
jgi:tRNA A-37 threonylcarbamoyl transferase component Bud32